MRIESKWADWKYIEVEAAMGTVTPRVLNGMATHMPFLGLLPQGTLAMSGCISHHPFIFSHTDYISKSNC